MQGKVGQIGQNLIGQQLDEIRGTLLKGVPSREKMQNNRFFLLFEGILNF